MRPFGLSKALSKSFADPVLEYLPDLFDRQEIFDSEYEDLESLAQLANADIVKERIDRLAVRLSPDEMTERVLYNDGSKVVVAGLRFRNLDLQFPFVALKLNFRADQESTIQLLRKLVRENFDEAVPRGFTLWEKPGQNLYQTETWSYIVAGPTASIEPRDLPSNLTLAHPSTVSEFYEDYKAEYEAWRLSHPKLAPFVQVETKEDLEASGAKGLLTTLEDAQGWAGLVVAKSSPLFGRKGLSMLDIMLSQRLRGQGLGKKLEATFVAKQRDQFELVWGHIHSENHASLRTAQSLGRELIQQEYFFSLDI